MEGSFPSETPARCNSQTVEGLTHLQQTAGPSTTQGTTGEESILGIHLLNGRQIVTDGGHGHAQVNQAVHYHQNTSNITEMHMAGGEILTPHYVIVEDPIALHSYAGLSSDGMPAEYNLPTDKTQSVVVVEKEPSSNNYQIYTADAVDNDNRSPSAEVTPKITEIRSLKKETILAVPVIEVHKPTPENRYTGSQLTSSRSEMQKQLRKHVIKKETENIQKLKSNNSKEHGIYESTRNMETDSSDLSLIFTKDYMPKVKPRLGSYRAVSMKESTNTAETMTSSDTSDNESSGIKQQTQDKIAQEKTMFSENLGLIPAEKEMKIIAERAKNAVKGVRTRKSLELGVFNASVERISFQGSVLDSKVNADVHPDENSLQQGHKHHPGCYRCGSCSRSFLTICKLHDHLQDHCFGGSYHFDHLLKTAFPKYDTTCSYAQTDIVFDQGVQQTIIKSKKPKVSVKFKAPKVKPRRLLRKSSTAKIVKKKRGRPRKMDVVHEETIMDIQTEMNILDDQTETPEEIILKEEPLSYNIDGTIFDAKVDTNDMVQEVEPQVEFSANTTSELVDKYLKDLEGDIAIISKSEPEKEMKKMCKRKMSIPRKIMVNMSESERIVNSRTKPEMKINCEFCSSKFQYTRGLIRHEQEKHADQMKHDCDQCDQKFMREYNLERHKLCSHNDDTDSKSKFMQERRGIYREKRRAGRKPRDKSPELITMCEICRSDVPQTKLDIHIRLHTGERPYICHVCGKGLISDKKLKRHLLIHSEIQRHTCDVCGQGFSMKYKLRTHMFIHTGHKPYLCSVCGSEFNNSTSLLHHNRTVHLGDKRFECMICGGRYGKKSQLEEHMFSHSQERTQTCRFCGKTFKHAKSLRRHEVTHVSEHKFHCDQCDSKFSRKDNLERHKMCHFEATLQCTFCKKKFRERQPLLEHEQYHINQRKHTCQICKDKFQDENYFYNHMEQNHGVTREMVPMINALATSPVKEVKLRQPVGDLVVPTQLKVSTSADPVQMDIAMTQTPTIDTLNLSMSVAGILPSTSSGQSLGNGHQSQMQSGTQSQNNLLQQAFNAGSLGMNTSRNILNQPVNPGFVSTGSSIPGLNEAQRMAINVLNGGENMGIRIPLNPQGANLSLNSDTGISHDQQRMIEDVVGSNLPNMQGPGYRLQNLFNQ